MRTWIEIAKALHELWGHVDTLRTNIDAIERARRGQEPYPSEPEIERAIRQLDQLSAELNKLSANGLGPYLPVPISLAELANPATRARALEKFRADLVQREAFQTDGETIVANADRLAREAPLRATALREVRDLFRQLVEVPIGIGTVSQAQAFHYYRLFERASGAMGNVGRAAGRALDRVRPELAKFAEETRTLKANLETFGVIPPR